MATLRREGQTLSWEGSALRQLARLAWPICVSMLSYSVMTLVDTLVVGRLGAAALAGVGLGGTAAFVLLCFSFGLLCGAKTLVSQAVGAGRRGDVAAHRGAALASGLALGVATAALGILLAGAIGGLSDTEAAARATREYLGVRILGAPLALAYVALREVCYGEGDARTPMVATVVANAVNVALACAFVLGMGWGVRGAAWATVVAHGVEFGVVALAARRRAGGFGLRAARAEHVRALFSIGAPVGGQFVLELGSWALLTAMIAGMGEVQMAAHQIALQVIHFSFLPAFAIAEAASVMAGNAVGAARPALVRGVARQALLLAGAYTGACTLALALGARWIAGAFSADATLVATAARLLWAAAAFQVFDAASMTARAVLRGAGDVRVPALICVATAWVCTPPLAWLLGARAGMGALGGWIGLCVEIVAGAAILWRRLERGGWAEAGAGAIAEAV